MRCQFCGRHHSSTGARAWACSKCRNGTGGHQRQQRPANWAPPTPPPPGAPRVRRARPHWGGTRQPVQPAVNQGIPPAAVAKPATVLLMEALATLEDALVAKAADSGLTAELEKQFEQYQKVKALALHPHTGDMEKRAAMRAALVAAIRMVV